MPTTRRNGAPKSGISPPALSSVTPQQPRSSRLPLFLAIYPATLLVGSLFSLLDPSARSAPYSALSQSHPPDVAPSYFAHKKNVFNLYFVKVGWFWITISYLAFLSTRTFRIRSRTRSDGGAEVEQEQSAIKRAQGLVRWVVVTAWWVVVAQWFFGPPLIDRGFKWTGGKCDVLLEEGAKDAGELVTAAACKLAGGAWIGGHDISGHVFLLVLGSAFLGMEVLPVFMARKDMIGEEEDDGQTWAVWFVGGVGALSWWMILMTATYFHTWFEKLTGLLVAFAAIGSVYFLPSMLPALEPIVGAPSA
ncbi:MAG: hypothetical protein MMC23_002664 [Stictis urceolatum]|nr:hypothetical protein [Stictis urceolata]